MVRVRSLLAVIVAASNIVACGGVVCEASGTGALTVNLSGLPEGVPGRVIVRGNDFEQALTASTTLTALPAGIYGVAVEPVAAPGGLVRAAFDGTLDRPSVCVQSGETFEVNVGYARVASSQKLWSTTVNGQTEVVAFAEPLLHTPATAHASVRSDLTNVPRPRTLTFDRRGNLWVATNSSVRRYPATQLGESRAPDAQVVIQSELLDAGPFGLAFDRDGDLWVSIPSSDLIVEYPSTQLSSGGALQPTRILTGADGPRALAFDAAGNLWASEDGTERVVMFSGAALGSTAPTAPVVRITATDGSNTLDDPSGLAFDGAGNLWVAYFGPGVIAKLSPTDLAGTGDKAVIPGVQLTLSVSALPEGLAFDDAGNLWTPASSARLARIGQAQLVTSGTVVPEVVLSSTDLGSSADWLAFYPAPANLPLSHSLP